jgi:cell division protein FtsI/penicillin-binding protein 2
MREVEMPARPGNDVYLTIDARVQRVVEEVLARVVRQFQARGGCVVMVEPATGRILSMASYPSYDPNEPPRGPGDEARRKNWAVLHTYEPGSVFKIVAAAAALDQGVARLSDTVDCGVNGAWSGEFGRERVVLKDVHRMKERYATVEQVIVKSSNIGTFQLALRLGRERYADYLMRFGFTRKTGIQLPYEESGYLLNAADRWSVLDYSRIQMGYAVAATPLQLAMAMAAVANDGKRMRPQIIDRVVAADGRVVVQPQAEVVQQVIAPETAQELRKALRLVIEDGTGSLAKLDRYTVAAKTGTSKIAPYASGRYSSSFLGFFPSEAPEVCMMVLVHDPNPRLGYYGGKVAGKVFQEIAMKTVELLSIPPDVPAEPAVDESVRALANRGRAR